MMRQEIDDQDDPFSAIYNLKAKFDNSNVQDLSSDTIRKIFKDVIFSQENYALDRLLSLLQRHQSHFKLKKVLDDVFKDDLEFFCKTVEGYVNKPFGGELPVSPQGLLLRTWILSPNKKIQNLNFWVEQIQKLCSEKKTSKLCFLFFRKRIRFI